MEKIKQRNNLLIMVFALVWLVNGLICKILNLVPRHQEIVSEILGSDFARELTFIIGLGEVLIAIWIISRRLRHLSAMTQIILIGVMNIMEFFLVPHLLLWEKLNVIFAFSFIILVYYQAFVLEPKLEYEQ